MNPNIAAVRDIPRQGSDIIDNYFKTIISYSHIMGSITSILVDYIRSAFNDKYFATIWNTLEVPYSQRSKSFKDIMSKPRPTIIFDPKFDPSDEAIFRPQMEFDEWIANDPRDFYKINSLDSELLVGYKNFELYYKPRRYKMSFNVHFSFDSDVQRIQCQEYMRQSIRHSIPIVTHRYIENVLPDEYMKAIADMNNMDYKSDKFLNFLNTFTTTPITRRLRTGSGNIEFFAMARSPIEIIFNNGPSSNGPITKGNITVASSFSEDVTVEFVAYSLLFLRTSIKRGDPIYKINETLTVGDNSNADSTTVGTDKIFITETPIPMYLNENCVKIQQITVQADKNGDDIIDLFNIMQNPEIVETLHYYKNNKKTMDFLHVIVYEDINIIDSQRYNLDNKTLRLTIKDMDVYKTYYIVIYMDKERLGSIRQKLFETDKINRLKKG